MCKWKEFHTHTKWTKRKKMDQTCLCVSQLINSNYSLSIISWRSRHPGTHNCNMLINHYINCNLFHISRSNRDLRRRFRCWDLKEPLATWCAVTSREDHAPYMPCSWRLYIDVGSLWSTLVKEASHVPLGSSGYFVFNSPLECSVWRVVGSIYRRL